MHVELSSTLLDISSNRITVRPHGRLPVFYIEPVLRDGWRARAKRTFDIVLSGSLILITAPVVLIAAMTVRLTSTGPAFFRQTRIGRDGRPFTIYKVRTMVNDAESDAPGPPQPQRARRPTVQDERGPADHEGRAGAPTHLDRRASAALERPER